MGLTRRLSTKLASAGGGVDLKRLDAYPKTLDDFRVKTYSGAIVSIVSVVVAVILFLGELRLLIATEVQDELLVDTGSGEKLRINIDVTMHALHCNYVSVDVMDISGQHQFDVQGTIVKQRLDTDGLIIDEEYERVHMAERKAGGQEPAAQKDGEPKAEDTPPLPPDYCGDCYGAASTAGQCCNTCAEVLEAYKRKNWAVTDHNTFEQCKREGYKNEMSSEGCRLHGYMEVNKVAGNFHVAPGRSTQMHSVHVHDVQSAKPAEFNMAHTINELSFGTPFPGMVNPLDGMDGKTEHGAAMFQFYIKVVPTVYRSLSGEEVQTNQYSFTQHVREIHFEKGEQGVPGVFFSYDLSPIMVLKTEHRRSFLHFLTSVCAIVGGVFTVASLVDATIYRSQRALRSKLAAGKHS